MSSKRETKEPAVRVFFAPKGSEKFWSRSLTRFFLVRGINQEDMAPYEDIFVILWHLDSYTWAERGPEESKRIKNSWLELAETLEQSTKAHIVILTPDVPEELTHHPRTKFVFPVLLLKSLMHDQRSDFRAPGAPVMWSTYQQLISFPRKEQSKLTFVQWEHMDADDSMLIRFCYGMAGLPIDTVKICRTSDTKQNRFLAKIAKGVEPKTSWLSHLDLFTFYHSPTSYRVVQLHGVRPDQACADQGLSPVERLWARKISGLEHVLSRTFVPRAVPLNILVVENNLDGLRDWDVLLSQPQHAPFWKQHPDGTSLASCFGYLKNARYYVIKDGFERLRSKTGRDSIKPQMWSPSDSNLGTRLRDPAPDEAFKWDEIDLVLQDVMLDKTGNALTGLDYTPYYLEACPQALVFVLTGMDVESLSMSGDIKWQYADAVISKRKLGSLWWNYYQAFCRAFGRMFWTDFTTPEDSGASAQELKAQPQFGDRGSLRKLFGSLRKWQMEPAILGHGQGVAEMIDHAHRHITRVWRLTDDFIGTLMENAGPRNIPLDCKDRMLLALGVWLHDIGHRGNEFTDDSGEIRVTHAGISEYLLLCNPRAYGAEWLLDYCTSAKCRAIKDQATGHGKKRTENPCLQHRNHPRSCHPDGGIGELCPLRKVGLLCRHHQSNAPLTAESLVALCEKGKFPSPYSRYKEASVRHPAPDHASSSQAELEEWMDQSKPLADWLGSGIRHLSEFETGSTQGRREMFMALAGLLRMMDGLQVHRARVGTPASLESFKEFLEVRRLWCQRELERIDSILCQMMPGSKEYQDHVGRRANVERYQRLVKVQTVHWWRQLAVHDVRVVWHNTTTRLLSDAVVKRNTNRGDKKQPEGSKEARCCGILTIHYELDDWGLAQLDLLDCPIRIIHLGKTKDIRPKLKTVLKREFRNLLRTESAKLDPWQVPLFAELKSIVGETTNSNDLLWAAHAAAELVWSEHESQVRQRRAPEKPFYLDLLPNGVLFRVTTKLGNGKPLRILEYLKQ